MKLYTTWPGMRKFYLINLQSGQLDYRNPITLFPNEPVEVEDSRAKQLMKQEGKLISTVPYDKLNPKDRFGKQPAGVAEDAHDKANIPFPVLPPDKVTDGSLKSKKKAAPEPEAVKESPGDLIPELPVEAEPSENYQEKIELLTAISDLGGVEVLTGKQIKYYARELKVKVPANVNLSEQRKLLDAACQELYEKIFHTADK